MGTSLQRTMALIPQGSLEGYIQAVNSIPVLSAEEERELAMRLQQGGDLEAARQLVMSHLRFVVHVAKSYSGYGLPQADLVQEGNIGLMKAVKRFDPSVGVRLVSFAVHWIKAEIHEYVLRNWRMVKVATTKAQRKLFFNLRKSKKRLGWLNHEEVQAVAADLGVSAADVTEMEARMSNYDQAFDLVGDDEDEGGQALQPGNGCAPGVLRRALDQGRDPRVHPAQLAYRQGRHHQGAAQAVLQPAQPEKASGLAEQR